MKAHSPSQTFALRVVLGYRGTVRPGVHTRVATRTRTLPTPPHEVAAITEWTSPTGALLRQLATTEGDVTFVAKDVCDALGIVNASKACEVLDEDEKGISTVRTLGGDQQMLTVTEPGLYRLILNVRAPRRGTRTDPRGHSVRGSTLLTPMAAKKTCTR